MSCHVEHVCCGGSVSLSEHERRVLSHDGAFRALRPRIAAIVDTFAENMPMLDSERALYFTRSMRETEGSPLVWRWAKALHHVAEHITVSIDPHQLLAGRIGKSPRYSIMYPEIEGDFYQESLSGLSSRDNSRAGISPEDLHLAVTEIGPYWEGKTYHERFCKKLPPEVKKLLFKDDRGIAPRYIVNESSSFRSSLQWVHDYGRVIRRGFIDIKREAEEKLAALDPYDPEAINETRPFYEAVCLVCDAVMLWAKRHADLARQQAAKETDGARRAELETIAAICERVPAHPARTFHEAVQCQWFVQLFSRLEQRTGTTISNGRMDQYLYPLYRKDVDEGRLTPDDAVELLECLWAGMAQFVEMYIMPQGNAFTQGYAHWEAVTIGGQTPEGADATNELSHLFLRSKREFPLHYPDLAARLHAGTPAAFLEDVAETVRYGTGHPKLLNDEEIVPLLVSKGAKWDEALDYAASGCTEVRMPNRDTLTSSCARLSLPAMLELVLYNGRMKRYGGEALGVETGDPRAFPTWEAFYGAFVVQMRHFLKTAFASQYVINKLRPRCFAQPMGSALHDLCMRYGRDLHTEHIPEGLELGFVDFIGFGTLIDSLSAVKTFVFDRREIDMDTLIKALEADFVGYEALHKKLQTAPAYGNGDPRADAIGKAVEAAAMDMCERYAPKLEMQVDVRYVPVTAHVPFGRVVSAMPSGRRAWTPLSDGTSVSHGADTEGPTGVLLSNAASKNRSRHHRAARMLNLAFTPKVLEGPEGMARFTAFLRTFVDLKLWHVQFNVVNSETLLKAQADPERYRSLIVRVAGYSAYFTDLSPDMQQDIIDRSRYTAL